LPLQSLKQKDESYLITSGTKEGQRSFPFPMSPDKPEMAVLLTYRPDPKNLRTGDAVFQIWPNTETEPKAEEKPSAVGKAKVGAKFDAGKYDISVKEVRFWVGMRVGMSQVSRLYWEACGWGCLVLR